MDWEKNNKKYRTNFKIGLFVLCALQGSVAYAGSLKNILKYSLTYDPILLEARADQEAATNRVEQAKSQHWPTVRLTGDSTLGQYHKSASDRTKSGLVPGIEVAMNVYSFGAIDAQINQNKATEEYYQYKFDESREELAYTISDLYLTALNAKESIKVLNNSLARHTSILDGLGVIVENDRGRESEYVQAESRKIRVVQNINDQQTILDSALSTLSKYTNRPIRAEDVSDPFSKISEKTLKQRFTTKGDESPGFLAQQAELKSKAFEIDVEKAKRYPSINLVGKATPDDRTIGLNMVWDVFNRNTGYTIREKRNIKVAAERRLERVKRDTDETARLALIKMKRNAIQLKTLEKQQVATAKVIDFYILQFSIARKSLLDVLNAENELSSVELAYTNTKNEWNRAVLSYLRSQGTVSLWAGVAAPK